ncbi:MAG: penicillin-binding transpeptidase domain-containing protein [Gemmatimonadetes bacterium]|nr:penicillin-binding transpeptidase domain-containing protein [Gemmatimonadota bacterium]
MAKPSSRILVLEVIFGLVLLGVLARAAQVQLVEGRRWTEKARAQLLVRQPLPARRGTIFDRHGEPLAITHEYYHLGVAPHELQNVDSASRILARQLGLSVGSVRRDLRSGRDWVYYRGPYTASDIEPLRGLRGVHPEPELLRFHPSEDLARPIIGRLDADGRALGGLELLLDSLLSGVAGEAVLLRDSRGRRYSSPGRTVDDPVPGHDVYLTLDAELQDIAERGLVSVIDRMEAEGGDVVFLDPATGELLALASRTVRGTTASPSAITTTFEPGSTAKLFTAAALLTYQLVDSSVRESGENGRWRMPLVDEPSRASHWRTIVDEHKEPGWLNLAEAVQVSSNIVMAKLAQRLSAAEQFDMLRAFGFGSLTGIGFPSESRGTLRHPDQWQPRVSRASIAMGYEFDVTPLQLAAAYGVIANDGILLTPTLVLEIRSPDGETVYRHRPEPVRRAVPSGVAADLREYLRSAVGEGGTGGRGQLANYPLMGKTGTTRIMEGGRYINAHRASFAALFPADDPQLVIILKVDRSRHQYFGGSVAAPVVRTMLNEALAARRIAIDRSRFVEPSVSASTGSVSPAPVSADESAVTVVRSWPPVAGVEPADPGAQIPQVMGLTVRQAVLQLHRRGFRVSLKGTGDRIVQVAPAGGQTLTRGGKVIIWTN